MGTIDPKEATQLMEDYLIVAGTGLGLGLVSASIGGLDKTIAGFSVPVDGASSLLLGLAGLTTRNEGLKIASIAAGGSASVRTWEKFFKKALSAHGEDDFYDQLPPGYGADYGALEAGEEDNDYGYSSHGFGFGSDSYGDPLLSAARHL